MLQGILDILSSDISQVGESDFVADAAVLDVPVTAPGPDGLVMYNANGRDQFSLGDNLLIQKIWCMIYWGFGQGGPATPVWSHLVSFNFWDGLNFFPMPPFDSAIAIPALCSPLDFGDGLFCPMATAGGLRGIRVTDIKLRINQINIPPNLDGERITVQYFMQVLHTKSMLASP